VQGAAGAQAKGCGFTATRKGAEDLAERLAGKGIVVSCFHGGLRDKAPRLRVWASSTESADVMVATIAFGLGTDDPRVAFVLHDGPPSSICSWVQQAGRAGRSKGSQVPDVTFLSADRATRRYAVFGETDFGKRDYDKAVGVALDPTSCRHVALGLWPRVKGLPASCDHRCDVCLGRTAVLRPSITALHRRLPDQGQGTVKPLSAVALARKLAGKVRDDVSDVATGRSHRDVQAASSSLAVLGMACRGLFDPQVLGHGNVVMASPSLRTVDLLKNASSNTFLPAFYEAPIQPPSIEPSSSSAGNGKENENSNKRSRTDGGDPTVDPPPKQKKRRRQSARFLGPWHEPPNA